MERGGATPLNERVRLLIDVRDRGSVNAAATRSGIPQATLARLADGRTQRPRSDLVRKVAEAFNVSTDWLLNGTGRGPEGIEALSEQPANVVPQAEAVQWWARLNRRHVSVDVRTALASLPTAAYNACFYSGLDDGNPSDAVRGQIREASRSEYRWCITWLDTLVDVRGDKRTDRWLEDNVDLIRGGFRTKANLEVKARREKKRTKISRSTRTAGGK